MPTAPPADGAVSISGLLREIAVLDRREKRRHVVDRDDADAQLLVLRWPACAPTHCAKRKAKYPFADGLIAAFASLLAIRPPSVHARGSPKSLDPVEQQAACGAEGAPSTTTHAYIWSVWNARCVSRMMKPSPLWPASISASTASTMPRLECDPHAGEDRGQRGRQHDGTDGAPARASGTCARYRCSTGSKPRTP